jgi:hypothetical protein
MLKIGYRGPRQWKLLASRLSDHVLTVSSFGFLWYKPLSGTHISYKIYHELTFTSGCQIVNSWFSHSKCFSYHVLDFHYLISQGCWSLLRHFVAQRKDVMRCATLSAIRLVNSVSSCESLLYSTNTTYFPIYYDLPHLNAFLALSST